MDGLLLNCLDLQRIQFLVEHLQGWRGGKEFLSVAHEVDKRSRQQGVVIRCSVLHMQFLLYLHTYVRT